MGDPGVGTETAGWTARPWRLIAPALAAAVLVTVAMLALERGPLLTATVTVGVIAVLVIGGTALVRRPRPQPPERPMLGLVEHGLFGFAIALPLIAGARYLVGTLVDGESSRSSLLGALPVVLLMTGASVVTALATRQRSK